MIARSALGTTLVCALIAGCVEVYDGSRIEANLGTEGMDPAALVLPSPGLSPGDPGYFSHYELHANIAGQGTTRLRSFVIQPALLTRHPCSQYEPDLYCVDVAGAPCDPYINLERFASHEEIFAVVSVAPTASDATGFGHAVAYDLMDPRQFPDVLFQNPTLTDPAAKLHPDNLVEAEVRRFCDALHPDYYLGNPNQLTQPRRGTLYGTLDGVDPRSGAQIGGISFRALARLEHMTELMITRERDPARLSPDNIDLDLPPGDHGQVLLLAQKEGPVGSIRLGEYRGVMTVTLASPLGIGVYMHATVYYDLDTDPYNF